MHSVILCDRMIPHIFNVHSQPSCSVIYVYINAQVVILIFDAIFFEIIIHYSMILLILMIFMFVNSLHRDYVEMKGDVMVVLPCDM